MVKKLKTALVPILLLWALLLPTFTAARYQTSSEERQFLIERIGGVRGKNKNKERALKSREGASKSPVIQPRPNSRKQGPSSNKSEESDPSNYQRVFPSVPAPNFLGALLQKILSGFWE